MDNKNKINEIRRGISLAKKGNFSEGISLLDKRINDESDQIKSAELYYAKARCFIEKKDYNDALEACNQAIDHNSKEAKFYDQKAWLLYKLKRFNEAVDAYDDAIFLKPNETKFYNRKAYVLSKVNKRQEAIDTYDAVIKKRADYVPAYNNKGILLSKRQQYQDAIKEYDKAIKKKADYALAYNNKAVALGQSKKPKILDLTSENIAGFLSIINSVRFEVKIPNEFSLTEEILKSFKTYKYNNPNFKELMNDANNDFKMALIHFMISIHNFKCSRLLSNTDSAKSFYQYTSLNTLKSLLNLNDQEATNKTKINVRLYNTDYMNDPEEGNTLINYLNGGAKHNNKTLASHTFISSLTPREKKDEIPMWRMYGDDYQGVSIGFKGFPRWNKNSMLDHHGDFEEKSMDHLETFPQMYKVYYLDERKKLSSKQNSDKEDENSELKSLKEKYDNLLDTKKEFFGESAIIDNFINFELEQVKFLVKDKRYDYEGEVRLVQTVQSFDKAKYEMNSPKLFLEYDNDLKKRHLEIVEIIFGVNGDLLENWLAIIEKKVGRDVRVTKSTVNYRSK